MNRRAFLSLTSISGLLSTFANKAEAAHASDDESNQILTKLRDYLQKSTFSDDSDRNQHLLYAFLSTEKIGDKESKWPPYVVYKDYFRRAREYKVDGSYSYTMIVILSDQKELRIHVIVNTTTLKASVKSFRVVSLVNLVKD